MIVTNTPKMHIIHDGTLCKIILRRPIVNKIAYKHP